MAATDCAVALVDKPAGVTSHDVVYAARRRLGDLAAEATGAAQRVKLKIGHAGTLDPFATGLLLILVGRATRLQRYLLHQPKTYRVVAHLGWRSDSGDVDGVLTQSGLVPENPQLPTGRLELPVPAHSAIKVEGERLYAKARRGDQFEPPVREMTVYRAERMQLLGERATFELDCAGGTYVRSVVATLKDAYCEELRRTRIGELSVEDAVPVERLTLDSLVDPLDALRHLQLRELSGDEGASLVHGRRVSAAGASEGEAVRLSVDGRLLGVGRASHGDLRAETILASSLEELAAR